ncbi:MAG TPA: diacylglycerol kinase family protein, partial [Mycobacterium sp.]|nr:diacylglycerol kinase family protein [Mycobacterium sp.]
MRAVLIVNPNATSTTPAGRDLLAHALESRVKLTVAHTDHRGHAIEIAQDAARDGVDLLIVHGGDGTVNEVVNGILGEAGPDGTAPAVGVVPGGSANVFARALGISPDPIEATNQLVDLLSVYRRRKSWRRIGLMDTGERWCVFTAGMGVDGDVVAAVEAQRAKGRKVTASRYIRVAIREMLSSARKDPSLTLHIPGREP